MNKEDIFNRHIVAYRKQWSAVETSAVRQRQGKDEFIITHTSSLVRLLNIGILHTGKIFFCSML